MFVIFVLKIVKMAQLKEQDKIMQSVLLELQQKYKLKYDEDITLKQLRLIVEVQAELMGNSIYTGEGIKLPNLGKFFISPKKSKNLTFEEVERQRQLQTSASLVGYQAADAEIGY
jgi:nucleoid DNA-binding protein